MSLSTSSISTVPMNTLAGSVAVSVRVSVSSTSSSSVARNTAVPLVVPAAMVMAEGERVKSSARLRGDGVRSTTVSTCTAGATVATNCTSPPSVTRAADAVNV